MEMYEENPVITRLKEFMAYTGLTNSQFADTATIPRPTLSQLLHGRNKSISDQLLKKLHDSFPQLDVTWLLFGKGDMLATSNIEISQPQTAPVSADRINQEPISQGLLDINPSFDDTSEKDRNYLKSNNFGFNSPESALDKGGSSVFSGNNNESVINDLNNISRAAKANGREKKIKSIIVFYQDSSFEVFSPSDSEA